MGRPRKIPASFKKYHETLMNEEIKGVESASLLDVSRPVLYRYIWEPEEVAVMQ